MADGGASLYLAWGAAAASAAAGTYSAVETGRARRHEMSVRKRQERLAARDRQIARNEELLTELSRRRAMQGAGGGTAEGSYLAEQNESERQAALGQLSDDAGVAASRAGLNSAQSGASTAGAARAAGSLLDFGSSYAYSRHKAEERKQKGTG